MSTCGRRFSELIPIYGELDRCPGGESVEEMTKRVDGVIAEVHEIHRQWLEEGKGRRDAMIVAHVRLLRSPRA